MGKQYEKNTRQNVNNVKSGVTYSYGKNIDSDSDTVSTYQISSVQLVKDKKLETFKKA